MRSWFDFILSIGTLPRYSHEQWTLSLRMTILQLYSVPQDRPAIYSWPYSL
ncbi:hypothetical protein COCCADRAFT_105880 [Bipolaris zeicola 26-R-13]|uniref:Uncharacterized protein n=1 Tax=Cochliobolus carbonum (strain 26-R-13) TaxID=930089 RepID=W6XQK6_COCC2|nr:uncharacterized protein COCCADRAFT_105880 [Bipolaris zeicola 26-R-13]EUC29677.1 hypothetical protein COCCADRAFT_105880 [Bipolaris zeicola 26-R-13]